MILAALTVVVVAFLIALGVATAIGLWQIFHDWEH